MQRARWERWIVFALGCASLLACDDPRGALQGELTFTRREGDNLVLMRSKADGTGAEVLFRGKDATNANVLFPDWSEDGKAITFTAMEGGSWRQMSIDLKTREVNTSAGIGRLESRQSHADELEVDQGSVYWKAPDGARKQLYFHKNFDSKFNSGASEVRWGPGKTHAIFQVCTTLRGCRVMVAPTDGGKAFVVIEGEAPVWRASTGP